MSGFRPEQSISVQRYILVYQRFEGIPKQRTVSYIDNFEYYINLVFSLKLNSIYDQLCDIDQDSHSKHDFQLLDDFLVLDNLQLLQHFYNNNIKHNYIVFDIRD